MAKVCNVDEHFDFALLEGASCAFGVFDGVHKGHRFIIEEAKKAAREGGGRSVVLTFDKDPDELFHADRLKKLMSNRRRIQALCEMSVDAVVVFPFTPEFASQAPEEFLASAFGAAKPASIHVGGDFRFGNRAAGTVADLQEWGSVRGTLVCAHNLENVGDLPVTSTRIRLLLADGRCEEAEELLGHPYVLEGTVLKGRGEGADMGFATANLELPAMEQVLGEGVYASYVYVRGVRYKAAVAVGKAPMFADATATCEPHILDFSGDIYGEEIQVQPVHFLRPMTRFESVDELVATVMGDIAWTRDNLS